MLYKIDDVKAISTDFLTELNSITELTEDQKLVITDGKLYIDTSSRFFQPITRWWTNQNRQDCIDLLKSQMVTYCAFMDFLNAAFYSENTSDENAEIIENVYSVHLGFIKKLVIGLANLTATYCESDEIKESITEIVINISKFKKLNTLLI